MLGLAAVGKSAVGKKTAVELPFVWMIYIRREIR